MENSKQGPTYPKAPVQKKKTVKKFTKLKTKVRVNSETIE